MGPMAGPCAPCAPGPAQREGRGTFGSCERNRGQVYLHLTGVIFHLSSHTDNPVLGLSSVFSACDSALGPSLGTQFPITGGKMGLSNVMVCRAP